ncbi:MFS general substrate transporter [Clavulina sp. PMI_390]|nr:MFS general substrate transporter [Clavulina sp. PMI_390]
MSYLFLAALELTSVGTALPTIVHALNGADFVWVGSAYALASAACMPTAGGLSSIFGRQPIMLASIATFAAGAAISGAARSMNMLIAARVYRLSNSLLWTAIQGAGGGGILTMSEIIVADIVPLRERGKYEAILGAVWALASVLGPPIGGCLAAAGKWRWLFYLNLPLSGLAALLVYLFLAMRIPKENCGNGLIISSTASLILALTWGGVTYPWKSFHVLLPLVIGFCGISAFILYESYMERENRRKEALSAGGESLQIELTMPLRLMSNRTSLSGFLQTFIHGITSTLLIYYLSTYFQGAELHSAIRAGVLLFPSACLIGDSLSFSSTAPVAVVTGISVETTGKYLPQTYLGWPLCMAGFGLLSLLDENSSTARIEGMQVILAVGLGILYVLPQFSVMAPLHVTDNASALALMSWCKMFGQTFGITIGVTILQNSLTKSLPSDLKSTFPPGAEISYALIPLIPTLPEALRDEVCKAFADAIRQIWYVGIALSGLGLVFTLPAKALPLSLVTDENWGFEREQNGKNSHEEAGILRDGDSSILPVGEKATSVKPRQSSREDASTAWGGSTTDIPLHPIGFSGPRLEEQIEPSEADEGRHRRVTRDSDYDGAQMLKVARQREGVIWSVHPAPPHLKAIDVLY